MDFGLVGIEGLESEQQQKVQEGKPKCNNGSGLIRQERSDPFEDELNRASKMAKMADDLGLRSDNGLPKQKMLSFSSSTKPEVSFLCDKDVGFIGDKNDQTLALSYYQQSPFPAYTKSPTGISGGIHGPFTGIRGTFTPAQWIELEHQAMIYKYLIANVPVPSNLLIPIRKALNSSGFPGFSIGSYPAHSYVWGSFHPGYSGSTDPEPGRCRRTDGKKWRCSREAVPDQKYCERHINRGRHRSRKPVEGLTGQAASGPTSTKVVPPMSAYMSSFVTSTPNSISTAQHHIKGLQSAGFTNSSTDPIVNRLHDHQGLSMMPPTFNLKSKDSLFSIPKQHISLDESSRSEFNTFMDFNTEQAQAQAQAQDHYPHRHFMDSWTKDQSYVKSDWTQLSMSIPMSSDMSSSSPNQDKATLSPLRLSRELDPSQMGLGVGPVAWGNSMGGGPLGEVLNKGTSTVNLKGEGWDGSPQLGSSPTGVLQKSTFVSFSNSSSGGSPTRVENNKTQDGASLCD